MTGSEINLNITTRQIYNDSAVQDRTVVPVDNSNGATPLSPSVILPTADDRSANRTSSTSDRNKSKTRFGKMFTELTQCVLSYVAAKNKKVAEMMSLVEIGGKLISIVEKNIPMFKIPKRIKFAASMTASFAVLAYPFLVGASPMVIGGAMIAAASIFVLAALLKK